MTSVPGSTLGVGGGGGVGLAVGIGAAVGIGLTLGAAVGVAPRTGVGVGLVGAVLAAGVLVVRRGAEVGVGVAAWAGAEPARPNASRPTHTSQRLAATGRTRLRLSGGRRRRWSPGLRAGQSGRRSGQTAGRRP